MGDEGLVQRRAALLALLMLGAILGAYWAPWGRATPPTPCQEHACTAVTANNVSAQGQCPSHPR